MSREVGETGAHVVIRHQADEVHIGVETWNIKVLIMIRASGN
jgi:hypothetical protein